MHRKGHPPSYHITFALSQLSVLMHGQGKSMFDFLTQEGVIADWREPNVIRMAPVPLYNTFNDVYQLGQIIEKALKR